MEMTLSTNIERQAIVEIMSRKKDESAPPVLLQCVKFAALYLVKAPMHGVMNVIANIIVEAIESRNDRIANHLRWFGPATDDLRSSVHHTGLPAGDGLRRALNGLTVRIDDCTTRLLPLVDLLDAGTAFGRAVHRSMRLLIEIKACAVEMKRAGMLEDAPSDVVVRIEAAHAKMHATHGRLLTGPVNRNTRLLALAHEATARRAARQIKPESRPRVLENV